MRLRNRLLTALGLLSLFVMLPGPDATGGPYLGYLQVRAWLLDARHSPLLGWTTDGSVPTLVADVRQSPTAATAQERAAYAALVDEWAAARSAEGTKVVPGTIDRAQLLLAVRIGERGVRAEMARADGGAAVLERPLPSRWSLLPAALAIVVAILTQRVLLSLLLACLAGSLALTFTQLLPPTFGQGLLDAAHHCLVQCLWQRALWEDFYLRITVFVLLLFATVAITQANGGFDGLVATLRRRVRGPVSAQLCTFATGCILLFDDYTNCMVTGSAMRPLCDTMRVSRAKLAWLVDTTAAPIAGLSIVSTWFAYEISQYRAPLALITRADGTPYHSDDAAAVFLQAMPFRFYCLFALALAVLVIVMRRDFGPMLHAERLARSGPAPNPTTAAPSASDAPPPRTQLASARSTHG